MSANISARPFQLLINGIDRSANMVEINLSSNEVGSANQGVNDVRTQGTITLKANYNEILDFTYLASPEIGANWAQGVEVIYKVANDAGTLVSYAVLYILREPDPPDQSQYQITLQVGDISTLKNSRQADKDYSGVIAGEETARDLVISRYLDAIGATYSLGSIPYPFYFPQPKTKGNSLIDVAGQMTRAANHILYCDRSGTIRNRAIDLNAAPIATFTIGTDEKFFDNNKTIEIPVGELIVSGLATNIKDNTYPKVSVTQSNASFTAFAFSNLNGFEVRKYPYVSQRVTITDFGYDGIQEIVETYTESAFVITSQLDLVITNPEVFLVPSSITTATKKYDSKNRLIEEREQQDFFVLNLERFGRDINQINRFNFTDFQSTVRTKNKDLVTTYQYNDATDELISKRTETTNYTNFNNESLIYGETAKEETWQNNAYTVANFYRDVPLFSTRKSTNIASATINESDWIPTTTETVYSTDSSTKPPQTTYRQQFEPIETPIKAVLKAKPFAGDAYKDRTPPIEVPYLESVEQATDFGNTYLSLLYGRRQGFTFVSAISTNLLTNLVPLARVNIIYRGVIYECLADAISWSHNLTEMAIGFNLIVLRTALAATPETINNLTNNSPLIRGESIQGYQAEGDLFSIPLFGGESLQQYQASGNLLTGLLINGESIQQYETEGDLITLDPVLLGGESIQVYESEGNLTNDSSPLDSDLIAYETKYNAAGSTLATGEQAALNTLITTLKTAGVWSKLGFLWLCPKSPSNTGSGSIYLKPYGSTDAMALTSFVLGDFSVDGLVGDGSTKWADTNIPTDGVISATGATIGIYCHSPSGSNSGAFGSLVDSATQTYLLYPNSATFGAYWECGVRANTVVSATTTTKGLTIGTLSATESTIYRDKSVLVTRSVSSNPTTVPSLNLRAWTRNINNNPPSEFSPYQFSLIFAYDKAFMSTTERDALYDAYAAYCSSIGRSL